MHLTDSIILEILFLVLFFGPLPVSYFSYADEEYKIFGFVLVSIAVWGILGAIGQIWPLLMAVPFAWYFALKPIFKKIKKPSAP